MDIPTKLEGRCLSKYGCTSNSTNAIRVHYINHFSGSILEYLGIKFKNSNTEKHHCSYLINNPFPIKIDAIWDKRADRRVFREPEDVEIEGLVLNGKLHGDATIRLKESGMVLFFCYGLGSEFETVKSAKSDEMWLFHAGRVIKKASFSSSSLPLQPSAVSEMKSNYGSASIGERKWGNYEIIKADLPTHFQTDLFASVHSSCKNISDFVTYSTEKGKSKTIFEFRIHRNQVLKHGLSLEYTEISPNCYLPYPSRVFLMDNNRLVKALCIVQSPKKLLESCDYGRTYIGPFNHTSLCWEGEGVVKSGDPSNRLVEIIGTWNGDHLIGGKGCDMNGEEYMSIVFSRLTRERAASIHLNKLDSFVDTICYPQFVGSKADDEDDNENDSENKVNSPPISVNSLMVWGHLPSIECLSLDSWSQELSRLVFSCSFAKSTSITLQHFPSLKKVVVSYSNLERCEQFFLLDLPALETVVLCSSCLSHCSVFVMARMYSFLSIY